MLADFRDLVVELLRADSRFLIIGAHALGLHGIPRATADLDVWVDATPENAHRTLTALAAFGAPLTALQIEEADFVTPDTVIQIGLPPYRVDILTGVSGLTFDEAWRDRIEGDFEGVRAPFIGRAALIRNKRATGRTKDLADLEALGEE